MKVIGITGGIGAGKSSVSSYLEELGYDVIDADKIAKETAVDASVLEEIREKFGDSVLDPSGQLDRKRMAEVVFGNAEKKAELENIITRRVIERVESLINKYRTGELTSKGEIVFLDAPTLFETGTDRLVDETWVVTCDLNTRLDRASKRDEASRAAIEARIASQMPEEEKKARSDEIIYNDGTIEELKAEIDKLLF